MTVNRLFLRVKRNIYDLGTALRIVRLDIIIFSNDKVKSKKELKCYKNCDFRKKSDFGGILVQFFVKGHQIGPLFVSWSIYVCRLLFVYTSDYALNHAL